MNGNRKLLILCFMILVPVIFILAAVLAFKYLPFGSFHEFRNYILGFGNKSAFAYIFIQAAQVMLPAVPSEIVQSVGGYVFGVFLGTIYSSSGILLGGIASFFSARTFGKPLVSKIMPAKNIEKLNYVLESPNLNTTIFLIYLIPGLPKDAINYIAGLTSINPGKFFTLATIGRLPGIATIAYMSTSFQQKNYGFATAIFIVVMLIFIAAGIFVKKVRLKHPKNHSS